MSSDKDASAGDAQELLRREESFSRSRRGACAAPRAQQSTLNLFTHNNLYNYAGKRHLISPPMTHDHNDNSCAQPPADANNGSAVTHNERTSTPPPTQQQQQQQQQSHDGHEAIVTLSLSPPPRGDAAPQVQQQDCDATAATTTSPPRSARHRYLNAESSATREFPRAGLRHVTPPVHHETPRGIRAVRHGSSGGSSHCATPPAAQQHIQVVNITPAYADPTRQVAAHTLVRAQPAMRSSSDVRDALRYAGSLQQLTGRGMHSPVGKPRPELRHAAAVTRPERFFRAVRDHAAQRARGVTEFYVHLTRDLVGGAAFVPMTTTTTTAQTTPRGGASPCSTRPGTRASTMHGHGVVTASVTGPPRPVLTLERCRDQLVALTSIPVTLRELACMLWDSVPADDNEGDDTNENEDSKKDENTPQQPQPSYSVEDDLQAQMADVECLDDEQLQQLLRADAQAHARLAATPVLFRHFAATFSR